MQPRGRPTVHQSTVAPRQGTRERIRNSRRVRARLRTHRADVNDRPRSVDPGDAPGAVLHAKAVIHDYERVLVTSANPTPKALDRNTKAGLLVSNRSFAQTFAPHFQRLIDTGLVVPFPPVG